MVKKMKTTNRRYNAAYITSCREVGSDEQKEIAKKTKYLFLVGDLVDGVGIHPRQYEELDIKDIRDQYTKLADYLKKIPKHI